MIDADPASVAVSRPDAANTYPTELTDKEIASLVKIAVLRGECGRLRSAIRDAIDLLPDGFAARSLLERALVIPSPENPR